MNKISTPQLHKKIETLVRKEREITAELIENLQEMERRRSYLELGYGSLFSYLVEHLGYSKGAASRRVSCIRLCEKLPEASEKLKEGSLNMSNASKLNTYLQNSGEAPSEELLQTASEKSEEDLERELFKRQEKQEENGLKGKPRHRPERTRRVSSEESVIEVALNEEEMELLQEVKMRMSHINPSLSTKEMLLYLMRDYLKRKSPKHQRSGTEQKKEPAPRAKEQKQSELFQDQQEQKSQLPRSGPCEGTSRSTAKRSRHIPTANRKKVNERDQGQCSFVSELTGKRCASRYQLEYDHVRPFALNGEHSVENLRLLCRRHHAQRGRLAAE